MPDIEKKFDLSEFVANPVEFDPETGIYTVCDETWSDFICQTSYKHIAEAVLQIYCETVLKYPEGFTEDLKLELTIKANLTN